MVLTPHPGKASEMLNITVKRSKKIEYNQQKRFKKNMAASSSLKAMEQLFAIIKIFIFALMVVLSWLLQALAIFFPELLDH